MTLIVFLLLVSSLFQCLLYMYVSFFERENLLGRVCWLWGSFWCYGYECGNVLFPKSKTEAAGCCLASVERWLESHMAGNTSAVDGMVLGRAFVFATGCSLVFRSSVAPFAHPSLGVIEKAGVPNAQLLSTIVLIFVLLLCLLSR